MQTCKLPKQFKQWVKSAGLDFEFNPRDAANRCYLTGYNRYFRIIDGFIDMSCVKEKFYNWDSDIINSHVMVKTEVEFVSAIKQLLSEIGVEV